MHPLDWVSTSPVFYSGRDSVKMKFSTFDRPKDIVTIINHDVWIGQYCLIKQGVTIGTGAVIGMGSVLTKDVPPYEIWAGNPAKFIKKRFDEETIEKLLAGKWWNKSDDEMRKLAKKIREVKKFVNEL
jgi:acetyltransferase-like isoleucine patch superfamily enzyme